MSGHEGGWIVPNAIYEDLLAAMAEPNWLGLSIGYKPLTWEERLAWAIKERSIRNRLRRGSRRISTAIDVLLDRHYCGDDY